MIKKKIALKDVVIGYQNLKSRLMMIERFVFDGGQEELINMIKSVGTAAVEQVSNETDGGNADSNVDSELKKESTPQSESTGQETSSGSAGGNQQLLNSPQFSVNPPVDENNPFLLKADRSPGSQPLGLINAVAPGPPPPPPADAPKLLNSVGPVGPPVGGLPPPTDLNIVDQLPEIQAAQAALAHPILPTPVSSTVQKNRTRNTS